MSSTSASPPARPSTRFVRRVDIGLAIVLLILMAVTGCASVRVGIGGADTRSAPASEPAAPSALSGSTPAAAVTDGPTGVAMTPRIGYISLDEDLAFVRTVSDGVRRAAEQAGMELVACDPDWTQEGVRDCAERLGDVGIDGLISFQPFTDLADEVCRLTGSVPTAGLVFDQGPCQVTRLRIDQAESGRLAGEAVGRFAAQRWDCEISAWISLESSARDPDGKARMAGYRSGFEEHCPLPSRVHILDDADRLVTAQTAVSRLLDDLRGPRIVVVGINEDAILGAMNAAAQRGRSDSLWYSGQLADPAIRGHIACDRRYLASVAQFPDRFGEQVVPSLKRALNGEEVPQLVMARLELVTSENVRELFPDTPACDDP
jgi:ribose transport system substrate-binding protein